jgi:exodeoxyribonuclease VII large subunit
MGETNANNLTRDVYSVSRLAAEARAVLEGSFPLLWVEGEISGLSQPRSGHLYFALKDPHAQVRCAMFRNRNVLLRFAPADGQQVLARVRVSFYEPRGEFQLVVEHMEPAGEGALRRAFDLLKARLEQEGLFDPARKRPLPAFPRRLGIVTSPSGAALHDVLTVLRRRFPGLPVVVYPVPVQGAGAGAEIAAMLRVANARAECDLLILTRGGGSPEDLATFNDEALARTIAALSTPIVSAVGHEIDFTIADFVADRRAPTPSAAAELASPDGPALRARMERLSARLLGAHRRQHAQRMGCLRDTARRLARSHPAAQLRRRAQLVDELEARLRRGWRRLSDQAQEALQRQAERLRLLAPRTRVAGLRERLGGLERRLGRALAHRREMAKARLGSAARRLDALSPLATLDRGYAIVRRADDGAVVRGCEDAPRGTRVEAQIERGTLLCRVDGCRPRER